jgi:D-alanyl-D-alanine carboxypeptidase (penicillin-binding protein 5/6)
MLKRVFAINIIIIMIFVSYSQVFAAPKAKSSTGVSAKGAVLVELYSSRILFAKDETLRLPMASTTKIMTALLAVESGFLDKTFTIDKADIIIEGSSMGLVAGEHLTLRELVYGLMMRSGNDAANVIATIVGGNKANFVKKMNDKAKSIGLTNTSFANPCGLDDPSHYTTAYELAKLTCFAMKNPIFAEIVGTKTKKITYNNSGYRVLSNSNRLLRIYDGAMGVKTGFTKKSGRCLVSCAVRDDVCLVVVTLSDPNDWDDHKRLLDYGFSKLKNVQMESKLYEYSLPVVGGVADTVKVQSEGETSIALSSDEVSKIKICEELPRFIYAPIKPGQVVGKIVYTLDNVDVGYKLIKTTAEIKAIKPKGVKGFFQRIWGFFFK